MPIAEPALCSPKLKVPWLITLQSMAFTSIQHTTEKAAAIVDARRKEIEANAHKYPPGLLEQYKIQLQMLKDKNLSDIEIVVFPFNLHPDGPLVSRLPRQDLPV